MYTIFNQSYQHLTLPVLQNGTNNLEKYIRDNILHVNINTTINENKYNVMSFESYDSCIYSKTNLPKQEYRTYLFVLHLKIEKDIVNNNIYYYTFTDVEPVNDPSTYIHSNTNDKYDYIDLIWYNGEYDRVYWETGLILEAFDINNNKIYGPNVTGTFDIYAI